MKCLKLAKTKKMISLKKKKKKIIENYTHLPIECVNTGESNSCFSKVVHNESIGLKVNKKIAIFLLIANYILESNIWRKECDHQNL